MWRERRGGRRQSDATLTGESNRTCVFVELRGYRSACTRRWLFVGVMLRLGSISPSPSVRLHQSVSSPGLRRLTARHRSGGQRPAPRNQSHAGPPGSGGGRSLPIGAARCPSERVARGRSRGPGAGHLSGRDAEGERDERERGMLRERGMIGRERDNEGERERGGMLGERGMRGAEEKTERDRGMIVKPTCASFQSLLHLLLQIGIGL
ncbi:unnamed protein product [Pleuronectes platessa]|uniref:Uncharacterized protein n=1 Tax=Pleuronectes platessa TaxID=8262 RepID=A0A9N7V0F8_PLEPL|nr:unnamed protein product [Pleuronectes platessa]